MPEKYALAWGGGKDSCLCLHKMIKEGKNVRFLFTRLCKTPSESGFLGTSMEMLRAQSEILEIPLVTVEGDYLEREKMEKEGTKKLKSLGVKKMAFGKCLPKLCDLARNEFETYGLETIFPFKGVPEALLVKECIDMGFKMIISCVGSSEISEWLGREINSEFFEEFYGKPPAFRESQKNSEVLGGLQSFVQDCPLFKKRIDITDFKKVPIRFGQGSVKVKALDSVKFKLVEK